MFSEQRNQLQGILLKNDQLDFMCEFGNIADNVLRFPVHSKEGLSHFLGHDIRRTLHPSMSLIFL